MIWVTDSADHRVWKIDPRPPQQTAATPVAIDLPTVRNPSAMVYVPEHDALWMVADASQTDLTGRLLSRTEDTLRVRPRRRIFKVPIQDPANVDSIPVPARAAGQPLTDLTWDGTSLWLVAGGGLCACVYKVDQDAAGQVLLRFFPRCEPVGLTIDRTGKRFWLAADQGEDRQPWLLERLLVEDHGGHPGWAPLYHSQQFLILESPGGGPVRPRGIVAVGGHIWVLDWKPSSLSRPARSRLIRYPVRGGPTP